MVVKIYFIHQNHRKEKHKGVAVFLYRYCIVLCFVARWFFVFVKQNTLKHSSLIFSCLLRHIFAYLSFKHVLIILTTRSPCFQSDNAAQRVSNATFFYNTLKTFVKFQIVILKSIPKNLKTWLGCQHWLLWYNYLMALSKKQLTLENNKTTPRISS